MPRPGEGRAALVNLQMWTSDSSDVECVAEGAPTFAHTFRHVYHFILRATEGNSAAATAIFQSYLAGELSEEFLSISRRWVNADQARARAAEEMVRAGRNLNGP
jgi:hypothetical protein